MVYSPFSPVLNMTPASTLLALALILPAQPEPQTPDVKETVEKGLKWLADQQKEDGSWVGRADSQPTTMTALAGLALLMDGSTLKAGPYAPHLRKAVEWMHKHANEEGLIGKAHPSENNRYMIPHAHALLFLACAFDVDDDTDRRKRSEKLLAKAVSYATQAQTRRGGWWFTTTAERSTDTSLVTTTMLQALQATRKVGIDVPKSVINKATEYLLNATTMEGGVNATPSTGNPLRGNGQPQLTAGATVAVLMNSDPRPEAFTQWIANLTRTSSAPPIMPNNPNGITTHFQTARVAFALGENGHRKLDPEAKVFLRWSTYRRPAYQAFKDAQGADGSWTDTFNGPVYPTAQALIILQLENEYLPAFSR